MKNSDSNKSLPWWKFGHVWLVISGPAIVVVAAFVTMYIAVKGADPVVADDYYRQGIEINKTLGTTGTSLAPSLDARNHAATGAVPTPKPTVKP